MRTNNYLRMSLGVAASILALCIFALTADAQAPKRKPKPLATPPTLTDAEIISRAGEEPVETTSEPIVAPDTEPVRPPVNTRRSSKAKVGYDEKQKRLMMNLDILSRAEQRSESLRKQLFEMMEKESTLLTRLDQIEYDSRPEMIERSAQFVGSLRPEQIRENRRKSLDAEKANLQALLTEIQNNKANLNANVLRADTMVEKLRAKLEKEIDDSLAEDDPDEER